MDSGDGSRRDQDREVQHQPPSPRDLERFPPRGEACANARAAMRAYADAEITESERVGLDEHIHVCRECNVALARAEAEVMRLREMFAAVPAPASDFTGRIMRAIAAEQRVAGSVADDVSVDFTPRVMDRVRREWREPRLARRLVGLARRQFAVLITAAALVLLALGWVFTLPADGVPMELVEAEGCFVTRGGERSAAREGHRLLAGDTLATEGDGGHALVRVPGAQAHLDLATLSMDPGTTVAVLATPAADAEPAFLVRDGAVSVHVASQRLSVRVPGEGVIALAAGRYRMSVEGVVRHDAALARSALAAVRVEVHAGAARLVRGGTPPALVEAGNAALFDGWSPIAYERLLDDAQLRAMAARAAEIAAVRAPARADRAGDWLGRVVNGQSGAGIAGATVRIATAGGEILATSESDGTFWVRDQAQLDGVTALAQVTLPMGAPRHAYAGVGSYFGPIEFAAHGRGPAREMLLEPLRLPPERPVMGMVLDPAGRPLSGARISALLVDEALGGAQSLAPGSVPAAITGGDGRFELRRLAAELPPHTSIYLVVEHARHGTVAAADLLAPASLHDMSLLVNMPARRVVTLAGLPKSAAVEVLESIPNMPASAMVLVRRVSSDEHGEGRIEVGSASELWLRDDERIMALAPRDEVGPWHPDAARPLGAAIASWAGVGSRGVGLAVRHGIARHRIAASTSGSASRGVRIADAGGRDVLGARVYLLHAGGEGWYLGTTRDPGQRWDLPAGGDYRLVAVTDAGEVGLIDATAADGDVLTLRVVPAGAAQLPAEVIGEAGLRPDGSGGLFLVQLTRVDGPLAGTVVHRHTNADARWVLQGIVPGHYTVSLPNGTTGRVYVPSGGVGRVEFSAPDPLRPPGTGRGR